MNKKEPTNELDSVFERAKEKYLIRSTKRGNTLTPWKDFTIEHLENRLIEEFNEWLETKNKEELLDIMNLASFVYMGRARLEEREERIIPG